MLMYHRVLVIAAAIAIVLGFAVIMLSLMVESLHA